MSIFRKISILFIISFSLMAIIGFWIDTINQNRIDDLIKDKYIKISNEILVNIKNEKKVNQILLKYHLKIKNIEKIKNKKSLYTQKNPFGFITISKDSFDDEFFIHIQHLDTNIILKTQDEENITDKLMLNYLIFLDVFILLLIFVYILKLLAPLKVISLQIKKFSDGDFSTRILKTSNDEIGVLANSFNSMAASLETLIKTREDLLKDIGHELRTPIAKGKFALEKIDDFSQKKLLKKIFNDLEILTNELLELEKLNSNRLDMTKFESETLVLESLSKLYIEDESKVEIIIEEDFIIEADLYYLCVALKNLIDNALKYTSSFPIQILVQNNKISILNKGEKLSKELDYYLKPFTQELPQRDGFGLGLSIVNKIIKKHNFTLQYKYHNQKSIFSIIFK